MGIWLRPEGQVAARLWVAALYATLESPEASPSPKLCTHLTSPPFGRGVRAVLPDRGAANRRRHALGDPGRRPTTAPEGQAVYQGHPLECLACSAALQPEGLRERVAQQPAQSAGEPFSRGERPAVGGLGSSQFRDQFASKGYCPAPAGKRGQSSKADARSRPAETRPNGRDATAAGNPESREDLPGVDPKPEGREGALGLPARVRPRRPLTRHASQKSCPSLCLPGFASGSARPARDGL